jgi:glycosyltransferase involved in cell wall biosynthesis
MKILWFVSSLEQKGGGERFVLEAVLALRGLGHEVHIACDRLDAAASFDGRYELKDVLCTAQTFDQSRGYVGRALNKLRGIVAFHGVIRRFAPDLVICQSEFDAIRLYLLSLSPSLNFRYRVFVFGQMYQFKTDISRYSSVFRRHLETIVASRPGYRDTVTMPPPRLPLLTKVVNEGVSLLKYRALRAADRVFTLSNQVRWEVSLVYGRDAVVCRAAFDLAYIDVHAVSQPRVVARPVRLLSVNRLVDKKRVDLTISAFAASTLDGHLTIIGTGPEGERLKAMARHCRRAADITFLGAVDDATLQCELATSECFISMDIGDYDISVVEAMGKGLRVIVATDFDMTEFGESFTGVAIVAPEVAALTLALENIPYMLPPSSLNLPALRRLSWQSLAETCVD